ncbi:hypothetical protein HD806DRAFT_517399 [Xylariaceae sp. AK1471]|nr:hypothetical protein HD806DRAFT_517399 [Xylariaceae sp. AK1471]
MFGYSKHACPGRYYCIRQVKLIFTKLLLEYDLKWPAPGTERPQRDMIEGQYGPNRRKSYGCGGDPRLRVKFQYLGEWS